MKTKNTKVRIKDLHHGAIIYRSHPVYGIEKKSLEVSRMSKKILVYFASATLF